MDRSGNDLDLAMLAADLLEREGLQPQIVRGTMTIPIAEMAAWLRCYPDSYFIGRMLSSGGIPYDDLGSSFKVERFWVSVPSDGGVIQFDPAFKRYTRIQGINLAEASGYDRTAFQNAAGGSTGTIGNGGWVSGVSESGIDGYLAGLATSLRQSITSAHNNATYKEIMGGSEIIKEPIPESLASLDFPTEVIATLSPDALPSDLRHTIQIRHGAIDRTFGTSEWGGRKWSITYSGSLATPPASAGQEEETSAIDEPVPTEDQENDGPAYSSQFEDLPDEPVTQPSEEPAGGAQAAPLALAPLDFGRIPPDTSVDMQLEYQNPSSTQSLSIDFTITSGAGNFRIVDSGAEVTSKTMTIPGGGSKKLKLRFKAGASADRGSRIGSLKVEPAGYQNVNRELTGFVAKKLNISVSGSVINSQVFTPLDSPRTYSFWIKNKSANYPLKIKNITKSGDANFTLNTTSFPQILNQDQKNTGALVLNSIPHGAKAATAMVVLEFDEVVYASSAFFSVSAQGFYKPDVAISGFDFDGTYEGHEVSGRVTLRNKGAHPLTINSVSLAGANPGQFQ
ncbi:MAG: hypothetical protein KJT03_10710, partial [Verrucomicrobiae bacterium]|nr:hypothetical protein [Verrucomicrobiae bacterium]